MSSLSGHLKEIEAYNECISSAVQLSNGNVLPPGILSVVRSVEDIDNDRKRNFLYSFPLEGVDSGGIPTSICRPQEMDRSIRLQVPSPSGQKMAILKEELNQKDAKSRQVLEIWNEHTMIRRILLPKKMHGTVVVDPVTFGQPCWNADETVIAYSAERLPPPTCSFFDEVTEENGKKKMVGGQNTLGLGKSENWGEALYQQAPLLDLFCVNTETGKIGKVKNAIGVSQDDTQQQTTEGSYALGQFVFTPDGSSLVYTAWDAGGGPDMPKRLGLIHCVQRPCKIYCSSIKNLLKSLSSTTLNEEPIDDVSDETFQCLTPSYRLARSPRFSPIDEKDSTSKLVFLASKEGFDTHDGFMALHAIDWSQEDSTFQIEKVLVKQIWDCRDKAAPQVEGIAFPGIRGQLPEHGFLSSKYLVVTMIWGSTTKIVRISLQDGKCSLVEAEINSKRQEDILFDGSNSQQLVCVTADGGAVISAHAPNKPAILGYIEPKTLLSPAIEGFVGASHIASIGPIAASASSQPSPFSTSKIKYQILTMERAGADGKDLPAPIQCILMLPKPDALTTKKPPLIVMPHGGPHSVSTLGYSAEQAYLCGHGGYALLLVNYRGSTGFGQAAIESLPTLIGDLDVKDVVHATQEVAESGLVDSSRLAICGGSHGGFLAGHCIGQYPELFKAACMRNPVTNVASMATSTDIPDWCYIEGLGQYTWGQFKGPTADDLAMMWQKSPIAHVDNVKVPTLIALGLKDLRVPPSQGIEFYHILRSKGVNCKLLLYEDCDHPIAAINSKADHWINIKLWFDEHLLK